MFVVTEFNVFEAYVELQSSQNIENNLKVRGI